MTRRWSDLLFLYQNCHSQADFEVGKTTIFQGQGKVREFRLKSRGMILSKLAGTVREFVSKVKCLANKIHAKAEKG